LAGQSVTACQLDCAYISVYISGVGKTKLTGKLMHLEPAKAKLLEQLARRSERRQSELMREAVDDLLAKYNDILNPSKRKP
jgi:hypothetical protein